MRRDEMRQACDAVKSIILLLLFYYAEQKQKPNLQTHHIQMLSIQP